MSSTVVGVYWSARAGDLQACARRAQAHFEAVARADDSLAQWFKQASRKPKVPVAADVRSPDALTSLMKKGVARRDIGRSVIEELGWSLYFWNGDMGGCSATTSIKCGCTSPWVSNVANLNISRETGNGLDDERALRLLDALADIWDAESGMVQHSTWNAEARTRETTEVRSFKRER